MKNQLSIRIVAVIAVIAFGAGAGTAWAMVRRVVDRQIHGVALALSAS
jgi:hypothetical protein